MEFPSFQELLEVAPIATIVVLIVGIGFWAGVKSQQPHIETLKEWLSDYRNQPKKLPRDPRDVDD